MELEKHDTTGDVLLPNAHANLLQICCRLVVYAVDLLWGSRQLVTDLLRRNWCDAHIFHSYPCIIIIIITQRSRDMIKNTHFLLLTEAFSA